MESKYTIGQLAGAAGVPTSTVRFYERKNLLLPDNRTAGNYRFYSRAALERLRFIRAAQENGFTLGDISTLLDFRDGKAAPCKEVQGFIKERLVELEKRLKQVLHLRAVLRSSLRTCQQAERSGRCRVLDELNSASSSTFPKAPDRKPAKSPKNSP